MNTLLIRQNQLNKNQTWAVGKLDTCAMHTIVVEALVGPVGVTWQPVGRGQAYHEEHRAQKADEECGHWYQFRHTKAAYKTGTFTWNWQFTELIK